MGFRAKQDTIERLGVVILDGENLAVKKSVLFNLPDSFFAANTYDNHFNGGENLLLFSQNAALDVYITTVEKRATSIPPAAVEDRSTGKSPFFETNRVSN
ncbi:hypothetical protein MKQ70_31985 [Chitinophaga sedimenti]|uniref:hypothetical protein n=1 Tax=Chitinophaga sedimenti TaxID=2033606 RepID=UPI002006C282|nr:hypothetical protein [Chitinophaga sedimenti]MCK7559338.1 hypothetical protein [Chitinophaga sedimenti]